VPKLIWNQEGQRRYEYGVDRGVFYAPDGRGYVWNGLVSVAEASVGGDNTSYYFDGVKYLDMVGPRNFRATISAYSSPPGFYTAFGEKPILPGFVLTRQARTRFGLSYRTYISGSDDYQIHIVYNAIASPQSRAYSTMSETGSAEIFSWKIDAVPEMRDGMRPTAHFILDSTALDPDLLDIIENIIYGSERWGTSAWLPSLGWFIDTLKYYSPLKIVPNPVTGLCILSPEHGDLTRTWIDGLNFALIKTRLFKTATDGIYYLEE
jgi:hypothetical protein